MRKIGVLVGFVIVLTACGGSVEREKYNEDTVRSEREECVEEAEVSMMEEEKGEEVTGIYVDSVRITRDMTIDFRKAFGCEAIVKETLYENKDEGDGESWEERLYGNGEVSLLTYLPLKDYDGKEHKDIGKEYLLKVSIGTSAKSVLINGRKIYVGMKNEELFALLPDAKDYFNEYNKGGEFPFDVLHYVSYENYGDVEAEDNTCPVLIRIDRQEVVLIEIDTRTSDELSGWVEFDCCVREK